MNIRAIDSTRCCRSNEPGGGWARTSLIYSDKLKTKIIVCDGCGNHWDVNRVESEIECHYCGTPAEIDIDSMKAYCCVDSNVFRLTDRQQELILTWLVSDTKKQESKTS